MSSPSRPSYWCYRCNRFVQVWRQDSVTCPECESGFIEEIDNPSHVIQTTEASRDRHRRFSPAAGTMLMIGNPSHPHRRNRRGGAAGSGDRSPINPVIVLRGGSGGAVEDDDGGRGGGGFELYYDDGGGSGLRPLPPSMSEFLLGSGFERLLDQLSQIEINGGFGRYENQHPPASKSAIESMPTVIINPSHIFTESHCAVCKEAFELESEAREMPCKHIYHSDCILPWLSIRNSCPVCRHELPSADDDGDEADLGGGSPLPGSGNGQGNNEEETVGLTIWRLPGGGYAVGRFTGARRGERGLPVVYTEMDGAFNNGGLPRRISWGSRVGGRREYGGSVSGGRNRGFGLGRALRHWFACFGVGHSSSSDPRVARRNGSFSMFSSSSSLRRRVWGIGTNPGRGVNQR